MSQKDYGIEEHVPMEDRHYSFWPMTATWFGVNAQPSAWYLGGVLAAAGFMTAGGVTLFTNPIMYFILALVGYMGFKVTTTTMGLVRVPFGIKGSRLTSILNSIMLIGWTAVGCFLGAISLSYLFNYLFGWPAYGQPDSMWVLTICAIINSALSVTIVYKGGSRAIKYAENIAVVAMLALTAWLAFIIFKTYHFADIMAWKPDANIRMSTGMGIDTVVAFSIAWMMCAAEFTRYAKTKATGSIAPLVGALSSILLFSMVGPIAVIAAAVKSGTFDPSFSDPSSVGIALGLGWPCAVIVFLSTISVSMVSFYSSVFSTLNIFDKPVSYKKTNLFVGLITIAFSVVPVFNGSFLNVFYQFMGLLGAVFPPLVAIMITDFYIVRKGVYLQDQLGKESGPYWYKNGVNWYAIASWVIGVVLYFVLKNSGYFNLSNTVGITLPVFAVTAIVYRSLSAYAMKKKMYLDIAFDKNI